MKILPEFAKKYSLEKNGIKNSRFQEINLTDEETALCSYCSAVGKLVDSIYYYNYENKNGAYNNLKNMVDTANRILEEFADPYLPDAKSFKKGLSFNKDQFLKANKGSSFAPLVADYMAGVVYAETLQKGFKLARANCLRKNEVKGELVNHYDYMSPDHIAQALDKKVKKQEAYR